MSVLVDRLPIIWLSNVSNVSKFNYWMKLSLSNDNSSITMFLSLPLKSDEIMKIFEDVNRDFAFIYVNLLANSISII